MSDSPEKTKLLLIVWSLEGLGGSETVVYGLAKTLDPERFDIEIVSLVEGPIRALYEEMGQPVHVFSKNGVLDRQFYRDFRALLKRKRYDVINVHHLGPFFDVFIAARGTGSRIAYAEHSRWELEELKGVNRIALNFMSKRAEACIAISNELHNFFVDDLGIEIIAGRGISPRRRAAARRPRRPGRSASPPKGRAGPASSWATVPYSSSSP